VDYCLIWGTWQRSWLTHCTTKRKIAGYIPDGISEIFHWVNPSGRTMALGPPEPLTEMGTINLPWGGTDCRHLGLPPSCADCLRILEAWTSWDPRGLIRRVQGQLYLTFLCLVCLGSCSAETRCTVPSYIQNELWSTVIIFIQRDVPPIHARTHTQSM
jgi:hypothetical protein